MKRRPSAPCLAAVIARLRLPLSDEKATQAALAEALAAHEIGCAREVRLGAGEVVDFMVGAVAVEVKLKKQPPAQVFRQLERYARHEAVREILLVTNRAMKLPPTINGKPAFVVSLGAAWL